MPGFYQVATIGPLWQKHEPALRQTLASRAADLGISTKAAFRVLTPRSLQRRDPRRPIVAAYFGGPPPTVSDRANVAALASDVVLIVPFVPSLESYTTQVPAELHGINGLAADTADKGLEALAARLYEGLGLVRRRRTAFISYRRAEASRAAFQLHQEFDARCWQGFLDTHSVDPAAPFQPVLWDRMNDADILVLLDSPGALTSTWVIRELEQANQLGMGVLQLVWPGHNRDGRTGFAEPLYLRDDDFDQRTRTETAGGRMFRKRTLSRVMISAERLRARSIASRRTRLVNAFAYEARIAGLTTSVQGPDEIEVSGTHATYRVYPVVGHVDSVVAHRTDARAAPRQAVLLYDPTGLLQERLDHINWLGGHLPVQSLPTTDISSWISSA